MSKEVQEKCKKLLYTVCMLVGWAIAILIVGFCTRFARTELCEPINVSKIQNGFENSTSIQFRKASDAMVSASLEVKDKISEQKALAEIKKELLTGKALYDSYVDDVIANHYQDLDPVYIRAIIYHESRYDPNCRNKKTNATGLMQILPKWHTKRARNLGVMDLFDPYGNILVGCDILHEIFQKYGFEYALNFYAGGYKYANRYKDRVSPYVKELNDIIALEQAGQLTDIYEGGA